MSYNISNRINKPRKHNRFVLFDNYGIGYTNGDYKTSFDSAGRNFFYFDIDDYDKIKDFYWKFNDQDYVITSTGIKQRSDNNRSHYLRMHRVVLGLSDEKIDVDHICGKNTRNDNRKQNLRICNRSENNMNVDVRLNNTSGVTGVSWSKSTNKWEAYINKNNKRTILGYFSNKDEAIKTRREAELLIFKEWNYTDSQKLNKGE